MSRRLFVLPLALLLGACLVALPACKKKKTGDDDSGGGGGSESSSSGPPPAVSSDYFLFAQLRAKDIRESPLLAEVKQAFAKSGGADEWNEVENKPIPELGIKWTEIDTVTFCLTEVPLQGEPKFVVILVANKAIDKSAVSLIKGQQPDTRGFYHETKKGDGLVHFPNDKTMVMVHTDLAQKYLDGYGKNRSGWPLTPDLTKAAGSNTLFVYLNTTKIPREVTNNFGGGEFAPLLAAQSVSVSANLKGKELGLAVRASFPDAATATQAKDVVQKQLGQAAGMVDQVLGQKELAQFPSVMPAVKEAQRALKAIKVEASGADVTAVGSYKADFDIGKMVADALPRIKESAGRMTTANNFKQIGLGLINYSSANGGRIPVLGVGANGAPLRNATDKPLLSWRVAILPYIEQGDLYKQFKLDEPWDGPNNKKLIDKMPKIFAPEKPGQPGLTHMQMVVGPNAMRPPVMMYPAAFTDGTSNTIAVVEAASPVIWTKPDDVMLPAKLAPGELKRKFGGLTPGGFNVVLWDGTTRFIRDSVSERTLGLALNPSDGQILPPDW
jgi:hypothetical protein